MPTVNVSPFGPKPQFFDAAGNPDLGYKLFTYVAGSTNTKQSTYTNSTGTVQNSNPILLNTLGQTPNELWFTEGLLYKVVLAPSTDTDPPTNPVWTIDNLQGINDNSAGSSVDQWQLFSGAPVFISANSFSIAGNQTDTFHIGRRLQFSFTGSGQFRYGRITNSVFGASTVVTMQMDGSQVLDSSLASVYYSLLTNNVLAVPYRIATATGTDAYTAIVGISNVVIGDEYKIKFTNPNTITNPTLSLDVGGALPLVGPTGAALLPGSISGELTVRSNGTQYVVLAPVISNIPRGYIDGFNMSAPGGGVILTINGGQATDSTNTSILSRTAVYTKNLNAWAVGSGNGGKLSAAAIVASTWYAVYEIRRYDTGVEDVGFDISPTTPTLPTGYNAYRRIGAIWLNASSQIEGFVQDGDLFEWRTPAAEAFSVTTTPTLRTLTRAPLGFATVVQSTVQISDGGGAMNDCYHWDPALAATLPGLAGAVRMFVNTAVSMTYVGNISVRTNSSAQIYNFAGGTIPTYAFRVQSWLDSRGKNN